MFLEVWGFSFTARVGGWLLGGVGLPAGEVVSGVASGGSGGDLLRAGFGVLGLGLAGFFCAEISYLGILAHRCCTEFNV